MTITHSTGEQWDIVDSGHSIEYILNSSPNQLFTDESQETIYKAYWDYQFEKQLLGDE
jgi:hypothetical protein